MSIQYGGDKEDNGWDVAWFGDMIWAVGGTYSANFPTTSTTRYFQTYSKAME